MSWKRCSSCRADIGFQTTYWECSVSTCNRPRTGLFFCSVGCWEAHLPDARHREAWAVEKRAPSQAEWATQQSDGEVAPAASRAAVDEPRRRVVPSAPSAPPPETALADADDDEILIVVSKLKKYVRTRSGMNTSDGVMAVLSDHLREVCDRAIRKAGEDGRKTVLDRDFRAILR